jgi:hypothetical protein
MNRGRPRAGGGKITMAAYSSNAPIDVSSARGFYIIADADAWIVLAETDAAISSVDDAGTLIAANQLYGPFDVLAGFDKFLHAAGDGVTGEAIVTVF